MTSPLTLEGVSVSLDPASTAAGATGFLLQTLGIATSTSDPAVFVSGSDRPNVDVVIAARPPAPNLPGLPPVWVAIDEHGFDVDASAHENDATLGFGSVAEMLTAAHAVLVALAGLYAARRSRQPLRATITMNEVMATCVADLLLPDLCERPTILRPSNDDRTIVLPCLDGAVSVALSNQDDRIDLAAMTGIDALADAPSEPLFALLSAWSCELMRDEIVLLGQTWRLPILPVLTRDEANREIASGAAGPFRITDATEASLDQSEHPSIDVLLTSHSALPLEGVSVLDLGMIWAGPYCGRLLAGLGAEVVKIEGPQRRDGTRPSDDWSGCSGFFADLNRNKRSLVLDLNAQTGQATFAKLSRAVDVILENFSPRVMPNFGLGYSALSKLNPKLVQVSMPAFESDSEHAHFVSYGSGLELMSGLSIPREGRTPEPAPVPYVDLLSGVYGAIAAVAALLRRDETGSGAHVEVAQHLVARDLRRWSPDDLWSAGTPMIDARAVARDPTLRANGLYSAASGQEHCQHLARCPWKLDGSSSWEEPSAPMYGANSAHVLRTFGGATPDDIHRLVDTGVVIDRPQLPAGVA